MPLPSVAARVPCLLFGCLLCACGSAFTAAQSDGGATDGGGKSDSSTSSDGSSSPDGTGSSDASSDGVGSTEAGKDSGPATFVCSTTKRCDTNTQFCEVNSTDLPPDFTCNDPPSKCEQMGGSFDCGCVAMDVQATLRATDPAVGCTVLHGYPRCAIDCALLGAAGDAGPTH
jgi:hypothetical protein